MHQQTEPYCKVLTYFSFLNLVGTEGEGAFRHDYRGWPSACFFAALFFLLMRSNIVGARWSAAPSRYVRTEGGREKEWQSANRNQAVQTQQNEDLQAVDYAASTSSASRKKAIDGQRGRACFWKKKKNTFIHDRLMFMYVKVLHTFAS